jgi:hypothetical protein
MKRFGKGLLIGFVCFVGVLFIAGCEDSSEADVPANSDMMEQSTVSGNWEMYSSSGDYGSKEVLPGTPGINITSFPPRGQAGRVTGIVTGVVPDQYVVVMYIHVSYMGWWIKPRFNTVIRIQNDGTFSGHMVTDGSDESANQVVVYLMPRTMPVDSALGQQSVPRLPGCPMDRVSR